jgi:hypothetical protein
MLSAESGTSSATASRNSATAIFRRECREGEFGTVQQHFLAPSNLFSLFSFRRSSLSGESGRGNKCFGKYGNRAMICLTVAKGPVAPNQSRFAHEALIAGPGGLVRDPPHLSAAVGVPQRGRKWRRKVLKTLNRRPENGDAQYYLSCQYYTTPVRAAKVAKKRT